MRLSHSSCQAGHAKVAWDDETHRVRKSHIVENDFYTEWLKRGLDKTGKSQSALARHLGLDPSIINKVVKGTRRLQVAELPGVATFLGIDAPPALTPIIGRAGADPGGSIDLAPVGDNFGYAPLPLGASARAVAIEIVGHVFRGWISADDGALIYYEDDRRRPASDMMNEIVIVGLDTDEVLISKLLRGEDDLYDLDSPGYPTRRGVNVEWAADITALIPPRKARQIIVR